MFLACDVIEIVPIPIAIKKINYFEILLSTAYEIDKYYYIYNQLWDRECAILYALLW
jgi:hypothetical protein